MKNARKYFLLVLLTTLGLSNCKYNPTEVDIEEETLPSDMDFSKFYVIGDQFASGYMDGAVYRNGQQFSFPRLVATKIDSVLGESNFVQPEVTSKNGYNLENPISNDGILGRFELEYPSSKYIYPFRNPVKGEEVLASVFPLEDVRDFSFPGLHTYNASDRDQLVGNLFYDRAFNQPISPLDQLIDNNPGVVLVSFGMENLISYSYNGASGDENPLLATISAADLQLPQDYETTLTNVVDRILSETSADVLITNLYNPLSAPFFQEMDWAFEVDIYPSSYIGNLIGFYNEFNTNVFNYNQIENDLPIADRRKIIDFDVMDWPLVEPRNRARVIRDEYTPTVFLNDGTEIPNIRMLIDGELIPYRLVNQISTETSFAGETPLEDNEALVKREIEIIENRLLEYNNTITNLVNGNDRIKLVDIKSLIEAIEEEEYTVEGVTYTMGFDRYSIFSADGYSLNPRGNAVIAKEIILTINREYGTNLRSINPNDYRGVSYDID